MLGETILCEFDEKQGLLQTVKTDVEALLVQLQHPIAHRIHSTSYRIKSRESLARKILQPDKIYRKLFDVTDIIGVRIITYFEDGIDEMAKLVEQAFTIDYTNSIDKRLGENPTQFGYKSLHYICHLPGLQVPIEIQIRTILQEAWAEIEHDLGYKSTASIPSPLRRRFSRLAGLLEMADEEFLRIRRELAIYEAEVGSPAVMGTAHLDQISLSSFVQTPKVAEWDTRIAHLLGIPLINELFYPDYFVRMLTLVGLDSINRLSAALEQRGDDILAFVPYYFSFAKAALNLAHEDLSAIMQGYSLFFLAYLVLLNSSSLEIDKMRKVSDFYVALDYPDDRTAAQRVAVKLLDTYREFEGR